MKGFLFFLCVAASAFSSCSDERSLRTGEVNLAGGRERTSSFERYGTFRQEMAVMNQLESQKNTKPNERKTGFIVPLLPLYTSDYYGATTAGEIMKIQSGKIQWRVSIAPTLVASAMCADKSDNLYAVANDGVVYSYSPDGKERWQKKYFTMQNFTVFSDLLAVSDGLIVSASSGEILKLSYDGNIQWRQMTTLSPVKMLSADSEGNLAVGVSNNTFNGTDSLLFINARGERLWARAFERTLLGKGAVISGDRIVVSGITQTLNDRKPTLHVLNKNGQILWSKELAVSVTGISAATDGTIFAIGYNPGVGEPLSILMAFTKDGKELWRQNFELAALSPVLISKEMLAFVGAKGKAAGVYYVKRTGEFSKVISLSEFPVLNLAPAVDLSADIIFGSSEDLSIIKSGQSLMQRISPF